MKYLSIVILNLLCISSSLCASEIILDKELFQRYLQLKAIENSILINDPYSLECSEYYLGKVDAYIELRNFLKNDDYIKQFRD